MDQAEKISILISHCSFPQKLAQETRRAVAAALGRDCAVKVLCPSQHERFITKQERQQGLNWPRQKTAEVLLKIIQRRQVSILLASDPVIDSVRGCLPAELKVGKLGSSPYAQLDLLPKQIERIFTEKGTAFNQKRFDLEFVVLKTEILKWMSIKVAKLRASLLQCHLGTGLPLKNFNLQLAHLLAEEEKIQRLLDELETKKNA
ncbi:MAG: hypothetical protein WCV72_00110 [Patescibacteria group bacterium]